MGPTQHARPLQVYLRSATICGPRLETESVLTYDLITLTFRPQNGVTGHLPAKFKLSVPFRFRLRVRHGTDRVRQQLSIHYALALSGGGTITECFFSNQISDPYDSRVAIQPAVIMWPRYL